MDDSDARLTAQLSEGTFADNVVSEQELVPAEHTNRAGRALVGVSIRAPFRAAWITACDPAQGTDRSTARVAL
ncbi:hypothetical protein [Xanthomonas vesicatoria]|uniref:Uncharacterized protein n=1 Tax=Xanthomonas vesicatoria TaxID=56460 RepID=A0AAJ0J0X3_9XANT|nr:hypothetical protein [Xanthomonas vesicatoria]APO96445.1 hypothetical protein BI313_19335 [Xanthomonas vesicatoria]KHM91358.1 hypothetical protein OR60_19785 [Xanthomonas vesicatoria]KHM97110.1 hypothetical protein OR61_04540 [Xanthomonas vesicatoria]MCC8622671.1 hypothetical protein [Xanthomonas vesicatoria]MCC8692947.1 hypothetical protein [Xanthomonas vesicatoria]